MYLITDTPLKNSYSLKMKINAYKDFHIFACISVIKTCTTNLVLKDKNTLH